MNESGRDPLALLCKLEADSSLFQRGHLRARLAALDKLDARFHCAGAEQAIDATSSGIDQRAKALRTRLEAANAEVYLSVRSEILRGDQPLTLLRCLKAVVSQKESENTRPGLGFDARDELVGGILQLRPPKERTLLRSPEMVPYQPTPVRHIQRLIAVSTLADHDVFVDLGSGLGHVPLLVSILTGARSLGIEVQDAYVDSAEECAQRLHLGRVRFITQDVRGADLSSGTVFYLYSPFTGSTLAEVLNGLRMESSRRSIKVCSLGPCTRAVANESWLKASTTADPKCISLFESQ